VTWRVVCSVTVGGHPVEVHAQDMPAYLGPSHGATYARREDAVEAARYLQEEEDSGGALGERITYRVEEA
jgi:hypothetical protein